MAAPALAQHPADPRNLVAGASAGKSRRGGAGAVARRAAAARCNWRGSRRVIPGNSQDLLSSTQDPPSRQLLNFITKRHFKQIEVRGSIGSTTDPGSTYLDPIGRIAKLTLRKLF